MPEFSLKQHGITVEDIRRNPSPAKLYSAGVKEDGSTIAASGSCQASEFLKLRVETILPLVQRCIGQ